MSDDYEPYQKDRLPREEGWEEETEEICQHLKNRGDLRIGQMLINAVSKTERFEMALDKTSSYNKALETVLWNIEASELRDALEDYHG